MKLRIFVAMVLVAAGPAKAGHYALRAQERIDHDTFWKIRQEATTNSQILKTAHMLTDLYGPRPTGSPNLKAAGEWAISQMQSWGLQNARLEPWDWGNPGWLNERLSAHIVSPVKDHLVAEALAWTPGTDGAVRANAVQITLPVRPTKEELATHLDALRSTVKGKIVLVGAHQRVLVTFNDPPERRDDRDVLQILAAPPAQAPARGTPPAQSPARGTPPGQSPQSPGPPVLTNVQITEQLYQFLKENGVPVRVNDAGRDHGQIRAFGNNTYDPEKAIPTVVLRNEDYGRISRLLADGRTVELEFDVVNRIYPEGRTSYNTVAEIQGATDEVVMLGGHLDSWHAATGATDNAIGCAVVMEAVRVLKAIGVKPLRTIRVALWSGEEQGLRGSRAYIRQQFGTFEEPKSAYAKFGGYVNIDSGTGRARSMTVFGPQAAATAVREAIAPFKDLGVLGATNTRSRQGGSSDHAAFNEAGLPGINVLQDPIEYDSATWHSNLDTWERIVEEDVMKSAIVVAATVYHLAMRPDPLPRFSKDEMPRRPGQR
jgi:carboxypeptidase Q